jgi:hypothetical protein
MSFSHNTIPGFAEEAARLKSAYRTSDYPDPDTVRAAFGLTYSYITFDLPGTLETISATMLKREERRSMEKVNNMLEDVNTYLREAMRSLVNHLVDRLSPSDTGKSKTFKSSTLTNLLEFLNTFEARNLGNDVELAQLVSSAKNVLSGVNSQLLRSDQSIAGVVQDWDGYDQGPAGFAPLVKTTGTPLQLRRGRLTVGTSAITTTHPLSGTDNAHVHYSRRHCSRPKYQPH